MLMRKIYPGGKITNDLDDLQRITYYRNGDFGYDFYSPLGRIGRIRNGILRMLLCIMKGKIIFLVPAFAFL